jgi:hypothetical protein
VYAAPDGSVHRPGINGWETRDKGGWQRPSPGAANTRDLDRDQMARQRGTNRAAPSSMGATPRSRPSGGSAARPAPRPGGSGGGGARRR